MRVKEIKLYLITPHHRFQEYFYFVIIFEGLNTKTYLKKKTLFTFILIVLLLNSLVFKYLSSKNLLPNYFYKFLNISRKNSES